MLIVIDLPDNFNLENEINTVSNSIIRKALKNGTPLPSIRGIVGSYYADKMLKMLNEIDKEKKEDTNGNS